MKRAGSGEAWASLALESGADVSEQAQQALHAMLVRMLGLSEGVEQFEQQHAKHPVLGKLLQSQAGLRVPASSTPNQQHPRLRR